MRHTPAMHTAGHGLVVAALLVAGLATALPAQTVLLKERGSGRTLVPAAPGDTVQLEVQAEFGRFTAAGLTVYVSVPAHGFAIVSVAAGPIPTLPGDTAVEATPFRPGPLFADALVVRNQIVPRALEIGAEAQLLEFSAVFGPAGTRGRRGTGRIARLSLRCLDPGDGVVTVYHSPLHESRIVLADGRTEKPLRASAPVTIQVKAPTATLAPTWGEVKRGALRGP